LAQGTLFICENIVVALACIAGVGGGTGEATGRTCLAVPIFISKLIIGAREGCLGD